MSTPNNYSKEDVELFKKLINENRYDFNKLVYIIFPFGQPGHDLEHKDVYKWQHEEWKKLSDHLSNPETRYDLYRLIISSGNGAAKTAFGAMTLIMLLYTQQLRARVTANTDPQMKATVWPEYDVWFRNARFNDIFFEKFGTSIKAKNEKLASTWRIDTFTWSEEAPSAISGLHNKGRAVAYGFEEAPGIPAKIWEYANGAFGDTLTIKIWFAFGNSDDPSSKFEQLMESPLWHSRRIDTRTLGHMDKNWINDLLRECNGNEDHDDFRVRVRGMPRKTSKDAIISAENIEAAFERSKNFDSTQVASLPCILTCDPAWQGGDETVISYRQGHYVCLLERYKLDRSQKENHTLTFQKLCHYEHEVNADAVFIDQAEGTAVYSMGQNAGKTSWFLIHFNAKPTDTPESKDSEYGNIRAQMYYEFNKLLLEGAVLACRDPADVEFTKKQLTWARAARHKITMKKLVEPKTEIKDRVGSSPDIADSLVLTCAMQIIDRLPENLKDTDVDGQPLLTGSRAFKMPEHPSPYADLEDIDYKTLYD
jgi:hypothetical protein